MVLLLLLAVDCVALEKDVRVAPATRRYEDAAAACPGNRSIQLGLAGAYLMDRRPKEALAEAERIVRSLSFDPLKRI